MSSIGSGTSVTDSTTIDSTTIVASTGDGVGQADSVQGKIQSACLEIEGMTVDLQSLVSQLTAAGDDLKALQGEKPVAGEKEKPEDFQARLSAWQSKVDALVSRIQGLQAQVQTKTGEIQRKQSELLTLEAQLPPAQAEDAQHSVRARAEAQKALDDANTAVAATSSKGTSSADQIGPNNSSKKSDKLLKPDVPAGTGIPLDARV